MRPKRLARLAFAGTVLIQLLVLYWPRSVGGAESVPYLDKVVHALVFGAVALTGMRAGVPVRPLAVVLAAHAGLSEVVQGSLLAQRGAYPWDAVADVTGTALGVLGATLVGSGRGSGVEESPLGGTLGA